MTSSNVGDGAQLAGDWFDGQQARPRRVTLRIIRDELLIETGDGPARPYACREVSWPEPHRHGQRQVLLPDGTIVHLDDSRAWDDWAHRHVLGRPWAARWASRWRTALLACVLLVLLVVAVGRWGIPAGARGLAALAPERLTRGIDRVVLEDLERRAWLRESRLPVPTQQALHRGVQDMVRAAYPEGSAPRFALELRAMPKWMGPNAFALPGGRIVVSDALVELMDAAPGAVHPAVLGVVAHELGHVRERHGLRLLIEASATGVLLGWWVGDFSSILASAPTVLIQAAYSRGHERSADQEALRVMRAAGVDPRSMVAFFLALKKASPSRDGDAPVFGLSTHPADSERIRTFEGAAR